MIIMKIVLFAAFFVAQQTYGFNTLPSFLTKCSRSDPNFSKCALENARITVPQVLDGLPEYHVPPFREFKIDYASLDAGQHIKLFATNVTLSGLDAVEFKNVSWDFDKKVIYCQLYAPKLVFAGTYNMDGKILIMTLKGTGLMRNIHEGNDAGVTVFYSEKTKKGKIYVSLDKIEIKLESKLVVFNFDNLLNNPELSKNMNKFLNENWEILLEELAPQIERIISKIIKSILDPIVARIPFENMVSP